MQVLIVEPEAGGHHFVPYTLHLIRGLQARGHDVSLLTTREAQAHPAMRAMEQGCAQPFQAIIMSSIPEFTAGGVVHLLRRQLAYFLAVRRAVAALPAAVKPDLVIAMSAAAMDRIISLLGSPFARHPFVLLFVQLKFHWPSFGVGPAGRLARLSEWSLRRILRLRTLKAVATIDELVLRWFAKQPAALSKLRYVPDPGEVKATAEPGALRSQLGIAEDCVVVLVYGGITARKGLQYLLDSLSLAPDKVVVVAAGVFDQEQRGSCATQPWQALIRARRLVCIDAFISLEQESALFWAADVVWLGYEPSFAGLSAVLPQASSAAKPVLAKRDGLIGELVSRHGLGLCVDPLDTRAVAEALKKFCAQGFAAQFETALAKFAATRSFAAYQAAWIGLLEA